MGAAILWLVLLTRLLKRQPLLTYRPHCLRPWLAEEVLLAFAMWLITPSLVLSLMRPADPEFRLLLFAVSLTCVGLVIYALLRIRQQMALRNKIGNDATETTTICQANHEAKLSFVIGPKGLRFATLTGLAVFVAWVPIVLLVHQWASDLIKYEHSTLSIIKDAAAENRFRVAVITLFAAAVVAPVFEEFLFRGILQGFLTRIEFTLIRRGCENPTQARGVAWFAILITSLAFGLTHFGQGAAPISLFLLSLGIGYLYDRTGSLWACIVVHFLLNFSTLAFAIAAMYQGDAA